jgi:type IV pilus assembly protein PilB
VARGDGQDRELALEAGVVTQQQLHAARAQQRKTGRRLGAVLVELGYLSEPQVTDLVAKQYGLPAVHDLDTREVPRDVLGRVPREHCLSHCVLPLARQGAQLHLAMADPTNLFAVDPVQFRTGLKVQPVVAAESAIARAIQRLYGEEKGLKLKAPDAGVQAAGGGEGEAPAELDANDIAFDGVEIDPDALGEDETDVEQVQVGPEEIDLASLTRGGSDRPVVGLVNRILVEAYRRGASDIHVEPYEKEFAVRFRIDGLLSEFGNLPPRVRESVTTRIKIMANLDIAERRLPQGGRIKIRIRQDDKARDLDFRVSCLPTLWGEKIVLRLLDKAKLMLDMTKLGFEPGSLERFKAAIAKPYGIVLVTGPTGSGKTNTLYSALSSLNTRDTNIMTAEDPVEFNLRGINQVQIREAVGLTFAMALREFLRQDPNIILVGEIRDYETAEIAVKAALTGHLVLSTLHTNDAHSTVSRLVNMGIEPFLVGTAVNLIQAQRLVRRVLPRGPRGLRRAASGPAAAPPGAGGIADRDGRRQRRVPRRRSPAERPALPPLRPPRPGPHGARGPAREPAGPRRGAPAAGRGLPGARGRGRRGRAHAPPHAADARAGCGDGAAPSRRERRRAADRGVGRDGGGAGSGPDGGAAGGDPGGRRARRRGPGRCPRDEALTAPADPEGEAAAGGRERPGARAGRGARPAGRRGGERRLARSRNMTLDNATVTVAFFRRWLTKPVTGSRSWPCSAA